MATLTGLSAPAPAIADRAGAAFAAAVPENVTVLESGPVLAAARGRWCLFRTRPFDISTGVPFVDLFEPDGQRLNARCLLGAMPRLAGSGCWAVGYVPRTAASYALGVLGMPRETYGRTLRITPVTASLSAAFLLAGRPSALSRLFRRRKRLRPALAELAITYNHPGDYAFWMRCFEPNWPEPACVPLAHPRIAALVFQGKTADRALAATLRSIQPLTEVWTVRNADGIAARLDGTDADYVAVLQAGETVPPHAWRLAQTELQRLNWPSIAIADLDEIDRAGERDNPQFRPEPNHTLMLSGILSRGLWLIRRDVLAAWPAGVTAEWAESLRLELWLRRYEARALDTRRIPHVLCHRGPGTQAAPPSELARTVNAHLARAALPFRATPAAPMRLILSPDAPVRPTNILIPSTLRTARAQECILALLSHTAHRDFTLQVVVTQAGPLDATQRAAAARISADPRASVLQLHHATFNYSQANNEGAASLRPGDLCLVNDDVMPLTPDWLDHMSGHLADPRVGVVGARLFYADGTMQHAGVLMGLGGLCDHAFRNLLPGDDGYMGRAALSQEFSAVTGACMLIRDGLFGALGGLDESYPSAFNDVDFCLRVRERGFAVVYAAAAALTHHEMQTYGSHYAGARAPFEQLDIARMRARWPDVTASDPFHSPNLDLMPGREWCNAFPPRRPSDQAWPSPA